MIIFLVFSTSFTHFEPILSKFRLIWDWGIFLELSHHVCQLLSYFWNILRCFLRLAYDISRNNSIFTLIDVDYFSLRRRDFLAIKKRKTEILNKTKSYPGEIFLKNLLRSWFLFNKLNFNCSLKYRFGLRKSLLHYHLARYPSPHLNRRRPLSRWNRFANSFWHGKTTNLQQRKEAS